MWINIESDDLRERADVLFGRHHAPAAGHHRSEELPAVVARRRPASTCEPEEKATDPVTIDEFTDALRARKKATGLYSERVGGVQFLSQNLFRATLALAPNVPVGTHKARAFLFKSGLFVKETSAPLVIVKSGFEQSIFSFAHDYSACSTASSPCCSPCSPAGSEASSSAGIEAAGGSSTTTRTDRHAEATLAARLGRMLALAGFVPFAVLAFWLYGIAPDHPWRQGTIILLTAYGAVVLSFLGGIRWGLALLGRDGERRARPHPRHRPAAGRLDRDRRAAAAHTSCCSPSPSPRKAPGIR